MGRTLAEYIFNEKLQPQRQLLGMGNGEHLTLAMNQGGPSNPGKANQGGPSNTGQANQGGPSNPGQANQGGPSNPAQPNQGGLANNFRQANPAEIEEQRNMLNMPQSWGHMFSDGSLLLNDPRGEIRRGFRPNDPDSVRFLHHFLTILKVHQGVFGARPFDTFLNFEQSRYVVQRFEQLEGPRATAIPGIRLPNWPLIRSVLWNDGK